MYFIIHPVSHSHTLYLSTSFVISLGVPTRTAPRMRTDIFLFSVHTCCRSTRMLYGGPSVADWRPSCNSERNTKPVVGYRVSQSKCKQLAEIRPYRTDGYLYRWFLRRLSHGNNYYYLYIERVIKLSSNHVVYLHGCKKRRNRPSGVSLLAVNSGFQWDCVESKSNDQQSPK